MKNIVLILFFVFGGCTKEYTSPVPDNPEFIDALVNNNNAGIGTEMTKILSGLNAVPSPSDAIGQQDNIAIAVQRLNSYVGLSAELVCYACIATNPPQSEIKVTIKDRQLVRYLNISTGTTLTFLEVHE